MDKLLALALQLGPAIFLGMKNWGTRSLVRIGSRKSKLLTPVTWPEFALEGQITGTRLHVLWTEGLKTRAK